jgi:hypothetical protein
MNRSEVSSKWNKCRIYVGDQLDRWNELKEVLRVQTRAEVANSLVKYLPTYILHLFHLEDTSLLFIFISESVKVRFLPRVYTFSFAQEPRCLLFLSSVHAQDRGPRRNLYLYFLHLQYWRSDWIYRKSALDYDNLTVLTWLNFPALIHTNHNRYQEKEHV